MGFIKTVSDSGTAPGGTGSASNLSQDSTSGIGVGALFNISWTGVNYTVTSIPNGGSGYVGGDTVTILGNHPGIGGATPANDLTITVLTTEADYTGSGGIVMGGSAPLVEVTAPTGSGGILMGGSAPERNVDVYVGSGGITMGGAGFAFKGVQYTGSGGALIAGTAPVTFPAHPVPSGGITMGGTVYAVTRFVETAVPGLSPVFGGGAATEFDPINLQPVPIPIKSKVPVEVVFTKQIPEFIRDDDPNFIAFMKAYYQFMEDEQLDLPAMTTIRNLELFRDIDRTLPDFITYLSDEFIPTLPINTTSNVRFFLKNIVSIYQAKGTVKSFQALFLLAFNKNVNIIFPWDDVIKVSDGKWILNYVLKVTTDTGNVPDLRGQLITQGTASGLVEDVFFIQSQNVYLITINVSTLNGTFVNGQEISGISNVDGSVITADVQTIVTSICVRNPGSYHYVGEPIQFSNLNTGSGVRAYVSATLTGGMDGVLVGTPGSGYREGEEIGINNAGTYGTGAAAIIDEVSLDALILETATSGCNLGYILTEDDEQIALEEAVTGGIVSVTVTNPGSGYNIPPILIPPSPDGFFELEDQSGLILTETGDDIVPESSSTGNGGVLIAAGHNIGRISKVSFIDNGINFTSPPLAYAQVQALINNLTGSFNVQEPLTVDESCILMEDGFPCYLNLEDGTSRFLLEQQDQIGVTGQYHILDVQRSLLSINNIFLPVGHNFEAGTTIRGTQTNSTARILDVNNAEFNIDHLILEDFSGYIITEDGFKIVLDGDGCGVNIGGMAALPGFYINDNGKLDDITNVIQDSFYYQVYSYVIRSN